MLNRLLLFLLLFPLLGFSQVDTPEAVLPVPSERQLAWHELEFYGFVHFNMNTFSDMEWGMGDEDPRLFNPTDLDCRQWARVCKEAGMKGIILTAKHHDGFCLWPSAYTEHSVKGSPWKNGKGDVLKDLSDACKEYGLKMGVYLSPWDRNHADYGTPEYITYFRNQLKELLTDYGDIFEVWFDGANGGTGYYGGANEERRVDKLNYYDWENTYSIIRELQPNAVIFSDAGPDVRWVGNEHGFSYETTWCNLLRDEVYGGMPEYSKKYSMGQENGTHWVAPEADVSIRPGWYYHQYEDHKVKTLPHLLDIYYKAVGQNASLLLNFPVDRRGLIHEKDVEQVMKLGAAIREDFKTDLARDKKTTASQVRGDAKRYVPGNIVDGDMDTYWACDDGVQEASVEIDLGDEVVFNRFLVQEYISLGQRVKSFVLEADMDGSWEKIGEGTTIGYKRILRLPDIRSSKVRFTIQDARACPLINNIGIYKAPKVLTDPQIQRAQSGEVTMQVFDDGLDIYYTLDGSTPTPESTLYKGAFQFDAKARISAIALDPETGASSSVAIADLGTSKSKWKVVGEFRDVPRADAIFDGNIKSAWTLRNKPPVEFIIDLGETFDISGFTYWPDQGRWNPGVISEFEFYVSDSKKKWGRAVSSGEFSNIRNNPMRQVKRFETVAGRYIKIKALKPAFQDGRIGIAEFGIITE